MTARTVTNSLLIPRIAAGTAGSSTKFSTKRTHIVLRGVLENTRDLAAQLQRIEFPGFSHEMAPFFRDIYDHVARNLDMVEIMRDIPAVTLDVYHCSGPFVSNGKRVSKSHALHQ